MNISQILAALVAASVGLLAMAVFQHAETGHYQRSGEGLVDTRTGELWVLTPLDQAQREQVTWELPHRRVWLRFVSPVEATLDNETLSTATRTLSSEAKAPSSEAAKAPAQ